MEDDQFEIIENFASIYCRDES